MSVDAGNVLVGAPDQATTGAIMSAVLGTAIPTSATGPINAAFTGSGYISEDGLQLTPDSSTTDIKDWSGATVRRILEDFTGTLSWAHLETSEEALRNWFGDENVTVTPANGTHGKQIRATLGAYELPRKSWVFKMKDGDARILIAVPDGQVTSRDAVSFTRSNAITWPVELTAYPDASGNSIYVFTDDGKIAAA